MFKKLLIPTLITVSLSFACAQEQPTVKGDVDNFDFYYGKNGKKKNEKKEKSPSKSKSCSECGKKARDNKKSKS